MCFYISASLAEFVENRGVILIFVFASSRSLSPSLSRITVIPGFERSEDENNERMRVCSSIKRESTTLGRNNSPTLGCCSYYTRPRN